MPLLKFLQIQAEAQHHLFVRESHLVHTDQDPDPQVKSAPTGTSTDPIRVDFGSLAPGDRLSVAFGQRLSEISFWNLLGLSVASIMFIWSAKALASGVTDSQTEARKYLDAIFSWDGRDLVWYLVSVLLALSLYLLLVSSDDELRIAGTFFCNTSISTIRTIQVVEGFFFVGVIVSAYTVPIGAMRLARVYYERRESSDPIFNDGLSELVSIAITPVILCVIPWVSLSIVFSSLVFTSSHYHAITKPGFGSLLSVFFWYIPFFWAPAWILSKFVNDRRRTLGLYVDPTKLFMLIQFRARAASELKS